MMIMMTHDDYDDDSQAKIHTTRQTVLPPHPTPPLLFLKVISKQNRQKPKPTPAHSVSHFLNGLARYDFDDGLSSSTNNQGEHEPTANC